MNAKIVRFGSESGWPNTCVKISDDAPSANANDRITVPITYSGATTQRSSAISTSRISSEHERHDQPRVGAQRLAVVVVLGRDPADQRQLAARRLARDLAQARDQVHRLVENGSTFSSTSDATSSPPSESVCEAATPGACASASLTSQRDAGVRHDVDRRDAPGRVVALADQLLRLDGLGRVAVLLGEVEVARARRGCRARRATSSAVQSDASSTGRRRTSAPIRFHRADVRSTGSSRGIAGQNARRPNAASSAGSSVSPQAIITTIPSASSGPISRVALKSASASTSIAATTIPPDAKIAGPVRAPRASSPSRRR